MEEEIKLPKKCTQILKSHTGPVLAAKFNSNGEYCISASQDKTLKLWNPDKGLLLKTYQGPHNYEVLDVTIHSGNSQFASAGGDKLAFLWDVATGKVLRRFQGHTQAIHCVAYSSRLENVLLTGSLDRTVRIWDLRSGDYHHYQTKEIQILAQQKDGVSQVITTEDQIIVSSYDGFLRVYDIRMGKVVSDSIGAPVGSFDLTEDGDFAVLSCLDSCIRLFDRQNGEIISQYKGAHTSKIYKNSVKFARDDKHLLCSSETHNLVFYSIATQECVIKLSGHSHPIVSVDSHPSVINKVLTGSLDTTLRLWEQRIKQFIKPISQFKMKK